MASWNSWQPIPGVFSTDTMPASCTDDEGKILYVIARRPDNGTIWWTHTDPQLKTWTEWAEVPGGGTTNLAPSIVTARFLDNDGSLHGYLAALAVGTDDVIYANLFRRETSAWSGWESLGGHTNAPVFGFDTVNSLRAFSKGIGDGKVYVNEAFWDRKWSGWKHVPGDFVTDFAVTPSRTDPPSRLVMALLGIRQSDHQVCVRYLEYSDSAGGPSDIKSFPSGWTPLPYSAKTNAPLGASLSKGYVGFGKGIGNGKIYSLTEKNGFSEVPGNGTTDAGLASASLVLSKTPTGPTNATIRTYLARNVIIAKGIGDGHFYFNYFDDEFSLFYLNKFP